MYATPEEQAWHQRLLSGDRVVTAELSLALLGQLVKHLRMRYSQVHDEDLLTDAASDALLSYFKQPQRYDPEQKSLLGYLKMAAAGDLKNLLAKEKSRQDKIPQKHVELDQITGNCSAEETDQDAEELRRQALALFDLLVDRQMVELLLDEVRETKAYAEILQITHLSESEQQTVVKRHKDRLTKRLQRHFKKPPS